MFQAIDKQTQLPVIAKVTKFESDIYEELETILKKRLEQSARGRSFLASGKPITKTLINSYYQIRYAVGVWLKVESDMFLPENDEEVVLVLRSSKYGAEIYSGSYSAQEGVFVANDREYDLCKVSEFLILPERTDDA